MITFLIASAGTISLRKANICLPQLLENLLNAATLLLGHDCRHWGSLYQGSPAPSFPLLAGNGSRCSLFLANSSVLHLQDPCSQSAADIWRLR